MKTKLVTVTLILATLGFIISCGGNQKPAEGTNSATEASDASKSGGNPSYDAKRGEGKHTAESLALKDKLDAGMATAGESVANVKCFSCHKITDEKLVGPGWKGVTARRHPEWIMNFITNPDPMIDKDPAAQAMLELCLVRMPNQSLSDEQARQILEFMRKNDGVN